MNVGDTVTLKAKTQHGRNRIQEQGPEWMDIKVTTAQRYSNFPEGTNIMLLASLKEPSKHWRWVSIDNDTNFQISTNN